MKICWSEHPGNRPTFDHCVKIISTVAEALSPAEWQNFLKLLETLSNDLITSAYYNINQIISLKRQSEYSVIQKL